LGSEPSESTDPHQRHHKRHVTPVPSSLFPDNAINWIFESVETKGRLVEWVTISGIKSNLLNSLTSKKPTLILFTPRNLLLPSTPYFEILREVAMDYFNCERANFVRSLTHRSILRRLVLQEKLLNLEESCHEKHQKVLKPIKLLNNDSCCLNKVIDFQPNNRVGIVKKCSCHICVQVDLKKYPSSGNPFDCQLSVQKHLTPFTPEFDPEEYDKKLNYCSDIKHSFQPRFTPFYHVDIGCFAARVETKPNVDVGDDDFEDASDISCSKLKLALNYSDFNFPEMTKSHEDLESRKRLTGLGCHSNRSLDFIAIDSKLFPSLAQSVGVDIREESHRTAILILDQKQESLFLLQKRSNGNTITKSDIYDFMLKFQEGSLTRFLRTSKGSISPSEHCLTTSSKFTKNVVCVPELSSNSFLSSMSKESRTSDDLVVFYYTSWCGFCSSISHVFLSVAKFFAGVDGVAFARINTDNNDLPVTYQVDRYPSIIFFPGVR
jgi:thiol-disulfide isomerase/thioredoxin